MNTFKNINATIKISPDDGAVLVQIQSNEDKKENKFAFANGIIEIFECLAGIKGQKKKILFNLRNVRVLTSIAWGAFFADVERKDIDLICLFNANKTIMTVAKQAGIEEREGPGSKIKVLPNDSEVVKILEKA